MKKNLFTAGLAFSALLLFSCNNVNNPQNNSSTEENAVTNNLSESKGTNELSGNTFSNLNVQYKFDESSVTQSNASSSALSSLRAAITYENAQVFNYSFDSESTEKTLEFQLQSVWGTSVAQDYEAQLENAKTQVSTAQKSVLESVDSLDFSAILNTFSTYLTTSGSSLTTESIESAIKTALKTKLESFFASQNSILSDYLASKYNAVIKFTYTLDGEILTLTEQFKGDLSDASSKFVSSDSSVTLNDYDNLIPFKIIQDETAYVGTPKITATDSTSGTLEVSVFPYYGDIIEEESAYVQTVNTQISSVIEEVSSDTVTLVKIIQELSTSSDTTSATLNALIDESFGSFELTASYKITEASDSSTEPSLTLTYTASNTDLGIAENDTASLTYTPLLEAKLTSGSLD